MLNNLIIKVNATMTQHQDTDMSKVALMCMNTDRDRQQILAKVDITNYNHFWQCNITYHQNFLQVSLWTQCNTKIYPERLLKKQLQYKEQN